VNDDKDVVELPTVHIASPEVKDDTKNTITDTPKEQQKEHGGSGHYVVILRNRIRIPPPRDENANSSDECSTAATSSTHFPQQNSINSSSNSLPVNLITQIKELPGLSCVPDIQETKNGEKTIVCSESNDCSIIVKHIQQNFQWNGEIEISDTKSVLNKLPICCSVEPAAVVSIINNDNDDDVHKDSSSEPLLCFSFPSVSGGIEDRNTKPTNTCGTDADVVMSAVCGSVAVQEPTTTSPTCVP
jgi:hypothetical protein